MKATEINEFLKREFRTRSYLFARWLSTCYVDEHIDSKKINQNNHESMSVLNREDGQWYKDQLNHFEEAVLPNYIKDGTYKSAYNFLK